MICVYFAVEKFDNVWYENEKNEVGQKYKDLETCKKDCADLKAMLDKFRISEEDEVYEMTSDPTKK